MAEHLRFVRSPRKVVDRARHPAAISRMQRPHHTVADQFEVRYRAYAKIFHAVFRDPDIDSSRTWDDEQDEMLEPISDILRSHAVVSRGGTGGDDLTRLERMFWRDLLGTSPTAGIDWRELDAAFNGVSWPRQIIGPDEGQPDRLTINALLGNLERAFGTDTAAWMFVEAWEARADHALDEGVLAKGRIRSLLQFIEVAGGPGAGGTQTGAGRWSPTGTRARRWSEAVQRSSGSSTRIHGLR